MRTGTVSERVARVDRGELGAVYLGGAVGALLRVWPGLKFTAASRSWPWVTFAIRVSGSVALTYFATRLREGLPLSTHRRPLLGTGFCGAYTTFSTMQVETSEMVPAMTAICEHERGGGLKLAEHEF